MMKKMLALLVSLMMLFSVCGVAEGALVCDSNVNVNPEELLNFVRAVSGAADAEIEEEAVTILNLLANVVNKVHTHAVISENGCAGTLALGDSDLGSVYADWSDGVKLYTDLLPSYAVNITAEELQPYVEMVQQAVSQLLDILMTIDTEAYAQPIRDLAQKFLDSQVTEKVTFTFGDTTYTDKATYTLTTGMLADAVNEIGALLKADAEKLGMGELFDLEANMTGSEEDKLDIEVYANAGKDMLILVKNGDYTGIVVTCKYTETGMDWEFAIGTDDYTRITGSLSVGDGQFTFNYANDTALGYMEQHNAVSFTLVTDPVPLLTYSVHTDSTSFNWNTGRDIYYTLLQTSENTVSVMMEMAMKEAYGEEEYVNVTIREQADVTVTEDGLEETMALYLGDSDVPAVTGNYTMTMTNDPVIFPELDWENMTVVSLEDILNASEAGSDEIEAVGNGLLMDLMGYTAPRVMLAFQTELPDEYAQIMSLIAMIVDGTLN